MKISQPRTRRHRLTIALLFGMVLIGASCRREESAPSSGNPGATPPRWNVLLITFDTTRFDHLSCYGYAKSTTPTVDGLARRGVRYAHCYSPAPITLPSHASILTGLYPFYHQLRDNGTGPLDDRAVTLAETLKEHGYRTGAVIGAFVLNRRFGLAQGFDQYDDKIALPGSGEVTHHFPERDAKAVTDAAIGWLKDSASPYFLWVHYFDPHQPYAAPGMPVGTGKQEAYDLEIAFADRHLQRLLERVRALEESTGRKTLIVFTADHGEALGDHGEDTHAFFVYNETIHVPLIVDLPDRPAHGGTVDVPVSLVDVTPSILHWLGIPPPYEMHGQPLPLGNEAGGGRRPLYFESHVPFNTYRWSPLEGVLVDTMKYIHAPHPEFYELAQDPTEMRNLYADRRGRTEDFLQALRTLQAAALDAPSFEPVGRFEEAETLSALRALGYVGAESTPPPIEIDGLVDPKDRVALHVRLSNLAGALESKNVAVVVATLSEALTIDPGNIEALRQLAQQLEDPEHGGVFIELGSAQSKRELPKPYDLRVPIALVGALVRAKETVRANQVAVAFVERHPDSAEAHNVLAASYLSIGDVNRAQDSATKASRIDPDFSAAVSTLGEIALAQGRFDDAIAHLEAGKVGDALEAPTLLKIGDAHLQAGRSEKAIASYQEAIDANPQFVEAYVALAEAYGARSDWDRAIEWLRKGVEIKPDHLDALYSLGMALNNRGDPAGAAAAFENVLRLDPNHGQAAINLGITLFTSGRTDAAIKVLQRAIGITSVAADAHYNLATAYARKGDNEKAAEEFERSLASRPGFEAPIKQLIGYYLSLGRAADAVRVLQVGVEHHRDSIVFHNMLAMVLATSRDDAVRDGAEALRHAQRADELTGHQQVDILGTLAAAYAEQGDLEKAQNIAQEAIDLARRGNQKARAKQLAAQLELYRAGKPYRDTRF